MRTRCKNDFRHNVLGSKSVIIRKACLIIDLCNMFLRAVADFNVLKC